MASQSELFTRRPRSAPVPEGGCHTGWPFDANASPNDFAAICLLRKTYVQRYLFNAQLFRPRSPSPSGAEPPSAQRVQQPGVPPACCERRVAVATGVGPIPARRGSGTPCKKPANLAVAGAEESPSFDDYKCTTQPQPLPPTLTPRVCCQLRLTTAPFARSPLVAELSGSASRTRCWS